MSNKVGSSPIFQLTNISPIAFRYINYPVNMCALCKGQLTEICYSCKDNNITDCDVIVKDDVYYHKHCLTCMDKKKST
jgi:hypothetical protein